MDEFFVEFGLFGVRKGNFLEGFHPNDAKAFGDGKAAADAVLQSPLKTGAEELFGIGGCLEAALSGSLGKAGFHRTQTFSRRAEISKERLLELMHGNAPDIHKAAFRQKRCRRARNPARNPARNRNPSTDPLFDYE
jgi:hypothetical protein